MATAQQSRVNGNRKTPSRRYRAGGIRPSTAGRATELPAGHARRLIRRRASHSPHGHVVRIFSGSRCNPRTGSPVLSLATVAAGHIGTGTEVA